MRDVWTAMPRKRLLIAEGILQSRSGATDKLILVPEIYLDCFAARAHFNCRRLLAEPE